MKIIESITDTNIGGAGILLLNRLKHTDLNKYDITVIVPQGSKLIPRLSALGIEVVELKGRGDSSFNIASLLRYIKVIKRISPDIVNAHSSLAFRIAALFCRVPVRISTRHCAYPTPKIYNFRIAKRIVGALCSRLSTHYIAVANAARDNLLDRGIPREKISVIINGADSLYEITQDEKKALRKRLNIPQNAKILIICARLEACKGHKFLLSSLAQDELCGVYLLVLGSGSLENELKSQAKALGIDGRVRFLGFVSDISPYMNIADININCSVGTETSCIALSEGMSLGKPCVASDYGGNPYMVRDGINGLLYPAGDIKKQSRAIARLCEDRYLYNSLSDGAKSRFLTELNAENMTLKTYALYEKLIFKP